MDSKLFWLRFFQTLIVAITIIATAGIAACQYQNHTMITNGYCERLGGGVGNGASWIQCDLLRDVVQK